MALAGFLPVKRVTSPFRAEITAGSRTTHSEVSVRQPHFDSILVPEQALIKGAVESFHDRLVPVNIHPPASKVCFVFFHLFDGRPHELAPRVHKSCGHLKGLCLHIF